MNPIWQILTGITVFILGIKWGWFMAKQHVRDLARNHQFIKIENKIYKLHSTKENVWKSNT